MSLKRVASLAIALGLALGATGSVRAAGFQFAPVRVTLNAHDRVGAITLTNPDDVPKRLETQVFRWTQRADGQPVLVASDALIVFPQLLTLPPHGQRNIRVATTDAPGALEATYKVSITEIGSFNAPGMRAAGVAIEMQVNVPVFIVPTVEQQAPALSLGGVQKHALSFAIVNGGTVHFVTRDVGVTGLGAGMRVTFSKPLDGGDVLAGGKREYLVDLPRTECASLRALTIYADAGDQKLTRTFDVPAGACGP